MRQQLNLLKSRKVFIGLITGLCLFLSACVSINTGPGQAATSQQKPQQNNDNITVKEKKVSMEEAASFNMTLGAQYLKQNKIGQAITKLEKAVEQQPNLALAHTYLGFAYEQYGEVVKAKEQYRIAIKLDPDDPVSLNNYGTFLCRQNDWRASLGFFEKAAENRRYQTPDAAYANAGVCARKIPDLVAADGYFRKALKTNPRYADAHYHLADLNLEQNNLILAKSFFEDYKKLMPQGKESPDYLWLGYRLHKATGNMNAAGQFSLRLQQQYPSSDQAKKLLDRS